MSEKQEVELNYFPDEILAKVFEHLDVESALKSSLVCKKWNEEIGRNSTVMKKMQLVVDLLRGDIQMPEKFTRRYQTIVICDYRTGFEFDWKLLEEQALNLRDLRVVYDFKGNENKRNFTELLGSLTELKNLIIVSCPCDLDLRHLNIIKSLELESCTILKFPEQAQLTRLTISNVKTSELTTFLATQKILEDLTIKYSGEYHCSINQIQAISFPLKKLKIKSDDIMFGSKINFRLFMEKFENSLEELKIKHSFQETVYEMLFNKFRKLKALTVYIDEDTPEEDSFYLSLHTNRSVQKLKVCDSSRRLTAIKGFIEKLPNLETLILRRRELSKELMMFIANNLKKLKSLHFFADLSDRDFEGVHIPSLKIVRINNFDNEIPRDWNLFVESFPNIEEFEIKNFREQKINQGNINTIAAGWPNLKRVHFGKGFVASHRILSLLLSNCNNLTTVEIYETAFESDAAKDEILREVARDGFTFDLLREWENLTS